MFLLVRVAGAYLCDANTSKNWGSDCCSRAFPDGGQVNEFRK
jgi:hypothetical protein